MRPGSGFLKELHTSEPAPTLKVYNFYSRNDKVATDKSGIFEFKAQVTPIPMHHLTHFQYLARRDVARTIVKILRDEPLDLTKPLDDISDQDVDPANVDEDDQQIDSQRPAV